MFDFKFNVLGYATALHFVAKSSSLGLALRRLSILFFLVVLAIIRIFFSLSILKVDLIVVFTSALTGS